MGDCRQRVAQGQSGVDVVDAVRSTSSGEVAQAGGRPQRRLSRSSRDGRERIIASMERRALNGKFGSRIASLTRPTTAVL
jgi:hypothetical protein